MLRATLIPYDPMRPTGGEDEGNMTAATSRYMLILAAGLAGILWPGSPRAEPVSFTVEMTGAECKPAVETAGTGTAALRFDPAARLLSWQITFGGLSSPATQSHIHAPGAEPGKGVVLIWLSKSGTPPESPMLGQAVLTPEQVAQFAAGQWWMNVHTKSNPACEIRGQVIPPKGMAVTSN
jgi:hypothetical protein